MSYLTGNETDEELEGKCLLLGVFIKQGDYIPGATKPPSWYAVHQQDHGRFFFKIGTGIGNATYADHHRHNDKRTVMQAVLKAFDNGVEEYKL